MRAWLLIGIAVAMAMSAAAEPQGWSNAPGWRIEKFLTDDSNGCAARRAGRELDMILIVNKRDRVVLIAARPEWRLEPKSGGSTTLSIDNGEPLAVKVTPLVNLVLYQPADAAIENRLLAAQSLHWHFPWGDFTADVTGMADAAEAVRQCNKQP